MVMGLLIILQPSPNQSLTSHHYRRIHTNRLDGIKKKKGAVPSKLSERLCLTGPGACGRGGLEEGVAGVSRGH